MKTQEKPMGNPKANSPVTANRKAGATTPVPAPAVVDHRAASTATIQFSRKEGESDDRAHARLMTSPNVHAAATIYQYHPLRAGGNITDLLEEVVKQTRAVCDGEMARPEAMLAAQAHTLDTVFNTLAQKAAENMRSGYTPAAETYLRMALKAQSQCRCTLEALAEIKQPRQPIFAKQANVGNNVQVNNGQVDSRSGAHARAQEKDITPTNKLLTEAAHAPLDTRGTGSTGGINQNMETVGAVNRPAKRRGKGNRG